MGINHSARLDGQVSLDIFFIFFNMKVCCVFQLESPHRGDSDAYKQQTNNTNINITKKITLNYPK